MRQRFKDSQLNAMYHHLLNNPPLHNGVPAKGSGLHNAFWLGYDNAPNRYQKNWFAYAAYVAGKDYRKKDGRYA